MIAQRTANSSSPLLRDPRPAEATPYGTAAAPSVGSYGRYANVQFDMDSARRDITAQLMGFGRKQLKSLFHLGRRGHHPWYKTGGYVPGVARGSTVPSEGWAQSTIRGLAPMYMSSIKQMLSGQPTTALPQADTAMSKNVMAPRDLVGRARTQQRVTRGWFR